MYNQTFKLSENSNGYLNTYVLDDGELARSGLRRPAVIVCPGGGYTMISKNEGEPVALAFNRQGYHAFVLNYSVKIDNPFPVALQELARAMKLVRDHADEWLVDADNISVIGFSAGGNLALSLGVYCNSGVITDELGLKESDIKPHSIILGYPAVSLHPLRTTISPDIMEKIKQGLIPDFSGPNIRQILLGKLDCTEEEYESLNLLKKLHSDMPPVFVWGSYEDSLIPVSDLTELARILKSLDVECELHLFGYGPHGMSLADTTVKDAEELNGIHLNKWFELALLWLGELK